MNTPRYNSGFEYIGESNLEEKMKNHSFMTRALKADSPLSNITKYEER